MAERYKRKLQVFVPTMCGRSKNDKIDIAWNKPRGTNLWFPISSWRII